MAELQEIGSKNGLGTFELQGSIVVGRDDHCDLIILSPAVSRMHAKIEREGNRFFIHDLNSRNGTIVNDRRIYDREQLRHGDVIDFSNNRFTFLTQSGLSDEPESGGEFRVGPTVVQTPEDHDSSIYREQVQRGDVVPLAQTSDVGVRSARISLEVCMLPDKTVPIMTLEAARKLQSVLRFVRALRQTTTLDEFFDTVVDCLFVEFPATERITITQSHETGAGLHVLRAASRNRSDFNYLGIPLIRHAANTRKAVLYTDEWNLSSSPFPGVDDLSHRFLMCLPLLDTAHLCCVTIQLETTRKDRAFQAIDLECLAVLGHVMSASLLLLRQSSVAEGRSRSLREDLSLEMESGSSITRRIAGDLIFRSYCPAGLPGYSGISDRSVTEDGRLIFTLITLQSPSTDAHHTSRLFMELFERAFLDQVSVREALRETLTLPLPGAEPSSTIASAAVVVVNPENRTAEFASTGAHCLFHLRTGSLECLTDDASVSTVPGLNAVSNCQQKAPEQSIPLGAGDSLVILNDAFLDRHRTFCPATHQESLPELLNQAVANPLVFDRVLEDFLESTTSHSRQNAAVAFAMIHQLPDNVVVASDCVPKGMAVE